MGTKYSIYELLILVFELPDQKNHHSDFLASCSSDFERGLLLGGWQPWLLKYRLTLVRYLPNSASGKKGKEPPSTSVRQN